MIPIWLMAGAASASAPHFEWGQQEVVVAPNGQTSQVSITLSDICEQLRTLEARSHIETPAGTDVASTTHISQSWPQGPASSCVQSTMTYNASVPQLPSGDYVQVFEWEVTFADGVGPAIDRRRRYFTVQSSNVGSSDIADYSDNLGQTYMAPCGDGTSCAHQDVQVETADPTILGDDQATDTVGAATGDLSEIGEP